MPETSSPAGTGAGEEAAAPPIETVAVEPIVPGTMYLQVSAVKESGAARQVLRRMKSGGHPVALDSEGGEWFRVLIGPFTTREEADAYQLRLKGEGIDSFLRKM
jgi:cell division septation protein DedD